jgi:hypothetical protein
MTNKQKVISYLREKYKEELMKLSEGCVLKPKGYSCLKWVEPDDTAKVLDVITTHPLPDVKVLWCDGRVSTEPVDVFEIIGHAPTIVHLIRALGSDYMIDGSGIIKRWYPSLGNVGRWSRFAELDDTIPRVGRWSRFAELDDTIPRVDPVIPSIDPSLPLQDQPDALFDWACKTLNL